MNGFALLGILCFIYSGLVFFITIKKPEKIWNMAKVRAFKKVLGEKGTVIFFNIFGLLVFVLGIWLIMK